MFAIVHRSTQSRVGPIKSSVIAPASPRSDVARRFIAEVFRDAYHAEVDPRPDAFVICERNTDDGDVPLASVGP